MNSHKYYFISKINIFFIQKIELKLNKKKDGSSPLRLNSLFSNPFNFSNILFVNFLKMYSSYKILDISDII